MKKILRFTKKKKSKTEKNSTYRTNQHNYSNNYLTTLSDVANTFLSFERITQKKLHILCYYAYARLLATTGEYLFEAKFEAWEHGPVIPELYLSYIPHKLYDELFRTKCPEEIENNTFLLNHIDFIYKAYGGYSENELEHLTRQETPWIRAREAVEANSTSNNIIKDEDIIKYYSQIN